jgi:hypothetical protein
MEYWEFLLQKEGERSWQPLKSNKIEVEPGRYRIVAHSSRINADVEICVTHTTTAEVPPKRRSQKRSRRTNSEGLMVVIPFTYLKPGSWELRCCGDIMSDFLGKSWQNEIKLQVLGNAKTSLSEAAASPSSEMTKEAKIPLNVDSPAPEPQISHNIEQDVETSEPVSTPEILVQNGKTSNEPEIAAQNGKIIKEEPVPVTLVDVETLIPVNIEELEVETSSRTDSAIPSNPILEQSLEMLEQILQQVLDPVLEEFEEPETESPSEAETIELTSPQASSWQGLTLNLSTDAHTAKRGETLTIAGLVEMLDVNSNELASNNFQGSLRYQLRDPQSSQLLLDVQHALSTQELPLAFSHDLEIPACNTRLMLGKVTLYDETAVALTSQPFTITADLDELLESIIPGTKVMPVAKMLVLANNFESLENNQALSELTIDALEPVVIDLIDTRQIPKRPLAPAVQKYLPPQIYQPEATPKGSKSLQLPNFPKLSVATETETKDGEVKSEETTVVASDVETKPSELETANESPTTEVPNSEEVKEDAEATDDQLSVLLVSVDDAPADATEVLREAATITPANEATVDLDLELSELWDTPEVEPPKPEAEPEPLVDQPAALDHAFQALNIQDRFWLRLNSLASDGELSKWLESDLSPTHQVEEVNQASQSKLTTEFEDVTQSDNPLDLIKDFDASIWENSEEFGQNSTDEGEQLELPQLPLAGVGDSDWAIEEIVVDDEDDQVFVPEPAPVKPQAVVQPQPIPESVQIAKSPVVTPAPSKSESPIPAPRLSIPKHELAVGEPVLVRVKLPPNDARLCVKLWVQDRQSRALLDGPRWLVDLLPDGAGQMEAMTQVVVPFGFDEIRFEAIAVDLDSQRESHKVTVDCAVMPPDVSNYSLDDFET